MDGIFFNKAVPFEKEVSDRLEEYLASGLSHDTVLELIGRDFPYMDNRIQELCSSDTFVHYYTTTDGRIAAPIKRVLLLHDRNMGDPFNTHVRSEFHIGKGEDLVIAVMVENPMFLHKDAGVHLSFHVNGKKVNELQHTIDEMDRRNVYYVPLCLHRNNLLGTGDRTVLQIDVVNENTPGQVVSTNADIYHGEKRASDIFTVKELSITDECGYPSENGVFCLNDISTIGIEASLYYSGGYEDRPNVEGVLIVSPSVSTDRNNDIICTVNLCPDMDCDGHFFCDRLLLSTTEDTGDPLFPIYVFKPGKYTFKFYVWGEQLWSKEIEFATPSDVYGETPDKDQDGGVDVAEDISEEGIVQALLNDLDAEPVVSAVSKSVIDCGELSDYFVVIGLSLFNVHNDRDDNDCCLHALPQLPMTSFNAESLKMLSVAGRFRQIKPTGDIDLCSIFRWAIYDDTGRMMDIRPVKVEEVQNEIWICSAFGDFCGQQWSKGTYRVELLWNDETVINAVFTVGEIDVQSDYDPKMITRKHTVVNDTVPGESLARLDKMIGLEGVKEKIHSLMSSHKLRSQRAEAGLPVKQPALHARFLGNPGTGKTTVARLLGQIYKEMGLLSSGHVVLEERKNMIGRYYDSEGQAVENALNRAKGGILLIDEAYNLYVENDDKDPGRRILEYLLTALADENNRDWMLILAGYPKEMEQMLESNPGIKSRVSEIFEFDNFNADQLLQIAELYCDDNQYVLSDEARDRLKAVMMRDIAANDKHFGNGRYVNKMMDTVVNTRMASRLGKISSPTYDQLVTIEADDIPIDPVEAERITSDGFDEQAIDEALKRLDSLVGLGKVKSAIHNFVNISRYLHSQGDKYRGKGLLKWNFTGNTGTGKSTVAQILADILKGMNLIQNNELTEVKGEEIFNVSDYECNEVIRAAVKRSRKGVLLIDGDAPEFRSSQYRMTSEQIRFKLATLASEDNASGALIIAECSSADLSIATSLAANGIYDFDHIFVFDDYSEDELYDILVQCLQKQKTRMSYEAEVIVREYIRNLCANRDLSFANARTMKNLSRAIFDAMILRLSRSDAHDTERVASAADVESFVWKKMSHKIGF